MVLKVEDMEELRSRAVDIITDFECVGQDRSRISGLEIK